MKRPPCEECERFKKSKVRCSKKCKKRIVFIESENGYDEHMINRHGLSYKPSQSK